MGTQTTEERQEAAARANERLDTARRNFAIVATAVSEQSAKVATAADDKQTLTLQTEIIDLEQFLEQLHNAQTMYYLAIEGVLATWPKGRA